MKYVLRGLLAVCLAAVLAGAWLRVAGLGDRPMHADEATGARLLAERLDGGGYRFMPTHFHGPLLTAVAEPVARLRGETNWQALTAETLRMTVAGAGILTILLIPLLRLGGVATLAGMAVVATSPFLIYYSRMFIHEPVFAGLAVPVLAGIFLLLVNPRSRSGILLLGFGIGLMAATRETVVLAVAAWIGAGAIALVRAGRGDFRQVGGHLRELLIPVLLAAGLALLMIGVAYAPPGAPWAGVPAFVATFFQYEVTGGHEKPVFYYAGLLLLPGKSAGMIWGEWPILLLALLVYLPPRVADDAARAGRGRFLFEAGVLLLLLYACLAYKTPWLAMLGWLQICLAAGSGVGRLWTNRWPLPVWAVPLIVALALGWQVTRAAPAVFRLSSDGRNPYAYVPTSRDVERWTSRLTAFAQNESERMDTPLVVAGGQYWPLPWYLRGFPRPIGYFAGVPEDAAGIGVVIVLPTAGPGQTEALAASHQMIFGGLREDFPVVIAVRNDLWEAWVNP